MKIHIKKWMLAFIIPLILMCIWLLSAKVTKRNFFQLMPANKTFADGYYITISEYPPLLSFFLYSYKYEYKLPGVYSSGYMGVKDSLIYEINNDHKFEFLNFRSDQSKGKNIGTSFPSYDYYKKNINGVFYFKFIPADFSQMHSVNYVLYKISFEKGILGFSIQYDNNTEKIYGEFP